MTKSEVITKVPNKRTARTLHDSRARKNVKQFRTKRELYCDLGMQKP